MEARVKLCFRILEDHALILGLEALKDLAEVLGQVPCDAEADAKPIEVILLNSRWSHQLVMQDRMALKQRRAIQMLAAVHDLIKDVQVILDGRRLAVQQLADIHVPAVLGGLDALKEVGVHLQRRPLPMIKAEA
jgi:hypothetical protein